MAISDKPILDPEASKPGIPTKKSTLAVIGVLLLTLGFVSSLVLSSGNSPSTTSPVAKDAKDLRQTGNAQQIRDEEAAAAKGPAGAASAPQVRVAASSPVPGSVRRQDNTSALFDQKPAVPVGAPVAGAGKSRDRELEFESTTRLTKAVVYDADGGIGALLERRDASQRAGAAGEGIPAPASAPSAGLATQIDAFKKQLMGAQLPGASKPADAWLKEYADSSERRKVLKGYPTENKLVLRQGKVLPAVLGRALNSDLPGRVTAYVSSNVYDSEGNLLVPMGAALVGQYDSGVRVGQSRLMFAFERLILPNGYSFDLPAAPGADLAGAAGMSGDVDNHFFKMFGTSLLIAILGDQTKQPQSVTQVGTTGPTTAAGQVLADVSKTILERNRVIPPTITVEQGTRINVEVVSDMVFPDTYRPR